MMFKNQTIWFGEKNSFIDFGLVLKEKTIGMPEAKTEEVDIPGADSVVDLTESQTGDVKYKNRKVTFEFTVISGSKYWWNRLSEINNYLHGQRMKIIMEADKNFYYEGRLSVNEFKSDKRTSSIVIEGNVDPYKYDRFSTLEEWEWDAFNLCNGIVQEHVVLKDLEVDGDLEIEIIGRRKWVTPLFIADSEMRVVHNGLTYTIPEGKSKLVNVIIKEGSNKLRFIGNGTISIDYRGGSL